MHLKKCNKCEIEKPIGEFNKAKNCRDGYRSTCKQCRSEQSKQYRKDNIDKIRKIQRDYNLKNKERKRRYDKQYNADNIDRRREYIKQHSDEIKEKKRIYDQNYKDRRNKLRAIRRQKDMAYVLNNRMRAALNARLKRGVKGGRVWNQLVGYSVDELIKRLKKTVPDGYKWEDVFNGSLHIDHINPVAVHNYEKPEDEDFKRCWSLENLQLLPATENLQKRCKIDAPFQQSLIFK